MDNNENSSQATYTVPEFAEKYRVHRSTVYRWFESGGLKSLKIGKCRRFHIKDLNEFLESHAEGGDTGGRKSGGSSRKEAINE